MGDIRISKKAEDVIRALKIFDKNNIKRLAPYRLSKAVGSQKREKTQKIIEELISSNLLNDNLELTDQGKSFSENLQ